MLSSIAIFVLFLTILGCLILALDGVEPEIKHPMEENREQD